MKYIIKTAVAALVLGSVTASLSAQNSETTTVVTDEQNEVVETTPVRTARKHAFEIGIGGSMVNWNRVSVYDYKKSGTDDLYKLCVDQLMGGVGGYLAYELTPWLYIDVQGNANFEKNKSTDKYDLLWMVGPGLQLRLNSFKGTKYIEPYLRVGAYYAARNFEAASSGSFNGSDRATWISKDVWNNEDKYAGKDGYWPLSFGAGVQGWFTDRFGIGLQGEYLMPVQKEMPKFAQLTCRLLFRIGGESKKPAPIEHITYVDHPVIREVPKEVVKYIDRPAEVTICNMLEGVYFDFDSDVIKAESNQVLDEIATILKKEDAATARFLLIGFTDIRGSQRYNKDLSTRRAKAVYDALIERGVDSAMLAYVGVGKKAALAPYGESHEVREGDRKVTIERIKSAEYWQRVINL